MGQLLTFPAPPLPRRSDIQTLLPGKLYFDPAEPFRALDKALSLYEQGEISKRVLIWLRSQIEERFYEAYFASE